MLGDAGIVRPKQFSIHLTEFGSRITILTDGSDLGFLLDKSHVSLIPSYQQAVRVFMNFCVEVQFDWTQTAGLQEPELVLWNYFQLYR